VPHWALFNPDWVPNLQAFVEGGGILILGARTATKDRHNNVIADTPPGVLYQLAGLQVVAYGRQNAPEKRPLNLRFYPVKARVTTAHWYEQLDPRPGTSTLARWENRHLRLKAGITLRKVGEGAVIYVGTYLNAEIINGLLPTLTERRTDLAPVLPTAPEDVHVVVREDATKRLWFLINNREMGTTVADPPDGVDLITGKSTGSRLFLSGNAVAVIKQISHA
jgi:beta-galactosidase